MIVSDYFINILERYIGRPFDIILANSLESSTDGFSDDISVKWGEYISFECRDKKKLKDRWTQIYERDLIDEKSNTSIWSGKNYGCNEKFFYKEPRP